MVSHPAAHQDSPPRHRQLVPSVRRGMREEAMQRHGHICLKNRDRQPSAPTLEYCELPTAMPTMAVLLRVFPSHPYWQHVAVSITIRLMPQRPPTRYQLSRTLTPTSETFTTRVKTSGASTAYQHAARVIQAPSLTAVIAHFTLRANAHAHPLPVRITTHTNRILVLGRQMLRA